MRRAVENSEFTAHDAGRRERMNRNVACDALITGCLFVKLLYRCGFRWEGGEWRGITR